MLQLNVPPRIKVGFQERKDTYTGRLAYVIYFDAKGVLRKATSWENWRDTTIDPIEYPNDPVEGFVLNKGVGGVRQSYGWNPRNEYIRVYDPRGFEIEISVSNLLFILKECDCSKGKGLEGKFVYAWNGKDLVLLPVHSQDYQNSIEYTSLQKQSVKSKDLIPGATYKTKKQQFLVFLGKFDWHFIVKPTWSPNNPTWCIEEGVKGVAKKYIFWDQVAFENQRLLDGVYKDSYSAKAGAGFVALDNLRDIAVISSDTPVHNYAELVDSYYKSSHGSKVVDLFLKDDLADSSDYYFREKSDGVFTRGRISNNHYGRSVHFDVEYYLKDGSLFRATNREMMVNYQSSLTYNYSYSSYDRMIPWVDPVRKILYAKLESGIEVSLLHE